MLDVQRRKNTARSGRLLGSTRTNGESLTEKQTRPPVSDARSNIDSSVHFLFAA